MRVPGVRFVQGRNRYSDSTKYAVAFHATANTAPAVNEAQYATDRTDGVGAHAYVDNIELIQSLDTNASTWHAGNVGNTVAIAVEITGLNSWSRAKWLSSVAWDRLGAWLAVVSRHHNIPATRLSVAQMKANSRARGAYDHNQMRLAWGGTDHTDPGPNFPWDHLLAVWQRHLSPEGDMSEKASRIIEAYANGMPKTSSGEIVAPTVWRQRDEAWQRETTAALNAQKLRDEAVLAAVRDDADRDTILARIDQRAAELRDGIPAAILSALPDGDGPVSRDDLVAAFTQVLGSVDGASPA